MVTMRQSDRVPGLNGLAFVYYKHAAGPRVEMVVQWFANKRQKRRPDLKVRVKDTGVEKRRGGEGVFVPYSLYLEVLARTVVLSGEIKTFVKSLNSS